MQSENKYIGDDKFIKFLEHYECPAPLGVVKMKFVGAICSPNLNLRPTDVISSLWDENKQPRLETKKEAELFFKFFMGLWDDLFAKIIQNKFSLPQLDKTQKIDLNLWCQIRFQELEYGFLEGFWGGQSDLKLPAFLAKLVDSLSELGDVYNILKRRVGSSEENEELRKTIMHTDNMVEKAICFLIENWVLPRVESVKSKTN